MSTHLGILWMEWPPNPGPALPGHARPHAYAISRTRLPYCGHRVDQISCFLDMLFARRARNYWNRHTVISICHDLTAQSQQAHSRVWRDLARSHVQHSTQTQNGNQNYNAGAQSERPPLILMMCHKVTLELRLSHPRTMLNQTILHCYSRSATPCSSSTIASWWPELVVSMMFVLNSQS